MFLSSHTTPNRSLLARIVFLLLVFIAGWYPISLFLEWGWEFTWDKTGWITLGIMLLSFGPGLVALIALFIGSGKLSSDLGFAKGNLFYLLPAWFLFPLLAALAAAISVVAGFSEWDWHMAGVYQNLFSSMSRDFILPVQNTPNPFAVIGGFLLFGPILWFIPALAEEMAWRGYLYQWVKKSGFWITGLLTGFVWWLWRLPLYLHGYVYVDRRLFALGISLCFALELGILLTWLRRRSNTVFVPAIAHATLFCSALLPLTFTRINDPHWGHLQGVVGIILLAIFILTGWMAGLFKSNQ
jgi:membrane protease YdiL (CAAX protease family)